MKRLLPFLLLLTGCVTENNVEPAKAPTFVRYFNGGFSDNAQQVSQTPDGGFIVLATTEIKTSELANPHYKIKLIKTDAYGNQTWQKLFPEFGVNESLKAHSLLLLSDGSFLISGDDLTSGQSRMTVLKVSETGEQQKRVTLKYELPVSGVATALNPDGTYLSLGSIQNSTRNKNMLLVRFGEDKLDSIWANTYGAGEATIAPRLFMDSQSKAFFGGTVVKDNALSSIRFVKVIADISNLGGIDFDLPLSDPLYTETGDDFCRYGSGFAVIGSTNKTPTGDVDILFKRIAADGQELSSQSFPIGGQQLNETGNSICATRDGGLLLLGTIDTQGDIGRGDKDFYLIKINAFGEVEWKQDFGSKFEDLGVNVIAASDGGYVVLGNTSLGRVKTLTLIKTNKNGKIE